MTQPARSPYREHRLELRELLEALMADGLVPPAQARDLLVKLDAGGGRMQHPLLTLADAQWPHPKAPGRKLTAEALTQWLAERIGLPYLRIDPLKIDVTKVTSVIPYAYAARARILPVAVNAGEVMVAVCEPYLHEWERELAPMLKQKIVRVLANPADIERYLLEFYALARSVKASENERSQAGLSNVQNLEQLIELGRSGKLDANNQHVVAIVDWLLQYAFEQRASDIHLEPRREIGNIRFRIDGLLHDVYQIPSAVMVAVTSRIKILARMDVAEKRKPQDGRIKTRTPAGKEVELRGSSLPTAFGEKLVLRIFDPEVLVRDFAQLGFAPEEERSWREMIDQPHGIILVTGPTGSGKTTTLYSTLKNLAVAAVNVCTIEDPIELVEPSFNQMQVNPAINLNFADGVRALLRQDPDIIMVGEIRDLETAEIAVQAALTGHLVLSTLHTNDASSAIVRLLDLGVPPYLIKATLIGVVAQRLLRRLCPHCKRPLEIREARWREIAQGWALPCPPQIYEAVGCLECRETGYLGRSGIYEIMRLNDALHEQIRKDTDFVALRSAALREGLVPLRIAGLMKVTQGLTSLEEVLALTPAA
ncbi:MAG: type II/IV secretion system protein [Nevskiaceae bacterium]|nr:MAG: type II/IV secretion system protein [Nevskiaceae bacterium]